MKRIKRKKVIILKEDKEEKSYNKIYKKVYITKRILL